MRAFSLVVLLVFIASIAAAQWPDTGGTVVQGASGVVDPIRTVDEVAELPPGADNENKFGVEILIHHQPVVLDPAAGNSAYTEFIYRRDPAGTGTNVGDEYPRGAAGQAIEKTGAGILIEKYIKQTEGQSNVRTLDANCAGPGDCIMQHYKGQFWGLTPASGDEGAKIFNLFSQDVPMRLPQGDFTYDAGDGLDPTETNRPVDLDAADKKEWESVSEKSFMVFENVAHVQTFSGAANDIETYSSPLWTVSDANDIPGDMRMDATAKRTPYCFALENATYCNEDNTDCTWEWLPVIGGPSDLCEGGTGAGGTCETDEFTTYWPGGGEGYGAPPWQYIPGDPNPVGASGGGYNNQDWRIAPCEEILGVSYSWDPESGEPTLARGTLTLAPALNTIPAATSDFTITTGGPPHNIQMFQARIARKRGTQPSSNAVWSFQLGDATVDEYRQQNHLFDIECVSGATFDHTDNICLDHVFDVTGTETFVDWFWKKDSPNYAPIIDAQIDPDDQDAADANDALIIRIDNDNTQTFGWNDVTKAWQINGSPHWPTATALAANPTDCAAGEAPQTIDANGNFGGCFNVTGAGSVAADGPTNENLLAGKVNTTIDVSSPVTVTTLMCAAGVISNFGATGSVTYNLPAAAAGLNCMFINEAAEVMRIQPDGTDRILNLTDANGDYLESDGVTTSSLTIISSAATRWWGMKIGVWTEEP